MWGCLEARLVRILLLGGLCSLLPTHVGCDRAPVDKVLPNAPTAPAAKQQEWRLVNPDDTEVPVYANYQALGDALWKLRRVKDNCDQDPAHCTLEAKSFEWFLLDLKNKDLMFTVKNGTLAVVLESQPEGKKVRLINAYISNADGQVGTVVWVRHRYLNPE